MTLIALRAASVATIVAVATTGAAGQTNAGNPHHPDGTTTQTPTAGRGQEEQPAHNGMMPPGMMSKGMMGGTPMMGAHGHMMKFIFAIADADGDGALSFEEVTAIHKRIFDRVDTNKDGKVTPAEVQGFMQE